MTRVLFLQQQPCIRTLKYAVGLRTTGRDFELGFAYQGQTLGEWYGTGDDLFDHWWHLGPDVAAELDLVIGAFAPDVIHSHNLPDRLTVLAIEVVGGRVPVIHDTHDLQSLRQTPYEDGFPEPADPLLLEKRAVDECSALVAVSDEMLAAIAGCYALPARTRQFPNYALARDLPPTLPPPDPQHDGPPRVVYQGTLSTNGGHYDLSALFTAIVEQGVRLDVYPSRPVPEYEALAATHPGMRCHAMLPPDRLLQRLPEYDFGWAAFNDSLNRAHLDTALPNKVFEYLGCGLPVLTLQHKALRRLVEEEEVGVALASLDDLPAQLAALDLTSLRRRIAASRHRFTVEANMARITSLYDEVMAS